MVPVSWLVQVREKCRVEVTTPPKPPRRTQNQGMIKEAIHCYVTAVRLMPKFAAVHSNLGSVLKEQGKLVRPGSEME